MTLRFSTALVALAIVAGACGGASTQVGPAGPSDSTSSTTTNPPADDDTPGARLTAARARWAEAGPTSYRLTVQELCFCAETIWVDTTVDGVVTSHEPGSPESVWNPGERTMEDLFAQVEGAIVDGYATLELEFDPRTGGLVRFWVDVDERTADEENGVLVSLERLDEPVIDPTLLVDHYGCGYLFALGSPTEDLALQIMWRGGTAPNVSSAVQFPSDRWLGELRSGSDLFANWCDDVIEVDDPTPVVDRTWNLTAGTLTIGAIGEGGICLGSVSASLEDAVVEGASGELLELGDLELVNDSFGCFAG